MEALLDVLASPGCIAHLALEVEQASAGVFGHLRLDALAAETAHILLYILLVKVVDHGAFVAALQENVVLRAEVTLYVHLCLDVLQYVGWIAIKLLAEHIKVHDRGLRGNKFGYRHFTLLGLHFFFQLTRLFVHDCLNAIE